MQLYKNNCLDVLSGMEGDLVEAIITDSPYGLKFMNKHWDYDVPNVEVWAECLRVLKPGGYLLAFAGTRTYHRMACRIEDAGFEIRDMVSWVYGQGFPKSLNIGNGWGTALKPAFEPIVMARKPLSEKTVAENVLKWGTGGINVDGCRVGTEDRVNPAFGVEGWRKQEGRTDIQVTHAKSVTGRFPANFIHDGSEEVVGMLNSTARFFYCAKASKAERNNGHGDNRHPTVKPVKLMEYLINLVTKEGWTVLDPFMGSGTTGIACRNLDRKFIGIEKDEQYFEIAEKRIKI